MTQILFVLFLVNVFALANLLMVQSRLRRVERRSVVMALWVLRVLESHGRAPITEPEMDKVAESIRGTLRDEGSRD
jgi:hypothetical protein